MSTRLSKEQIEDLLIYCNTQPTRWRDEDMLVCCPVHGETHPSMGVSAEKQVCHCFSCGFAGDFAKLLQNSLPEEFGYDKNNEQRTFVKSYKSARDFLSSRYELEYRELGVKYRAIKRYEQATNRYLKEDSRIILPKYKLAPFKSGKETYQYFFDRGFNREDLRKYFIGRDLDSKTITIPVFYEDNSLAGIIGRYIDPNRRKNERYKIYEGFERSLLLYPLNLAKPIDNTIIIVEGQFDAIRMHKIGYTNTYALMTSTLSNAQAKWIIYNCSRVIWVGDNDVRGLESRDKAKTLLKSKVQFFVVDYPNYGKDVCDWSDEDIHLMIKDSHSIIKRKLKRL